MKRSKSVEILSNFQNFKSPCANVKPLIEHFLETVLVCTSHRHATRGRSPTWNIFLR